MPDPQAKDTQRPQEIPTTANAQERRTQARKEGVLRQIEDATYAILPKHENTTVVGRPCCPAQTCQALELSLERRPAEVPPFSIRH